MTNHLTSKRIIVLISLVCGIGGVSCSHNHHMYHHSHGAGGGDGLKDETVLRPAYLLEEIPPSQPEPPKPILMAMPESPTSTVETAPGTPEDALVALEQANENATERSAEPQFVSATLFYDYFPGTRFEVICSPGYLTTLKFRSGETIVSIASGDTTRWRVAASAGPNEQTLVLIKPFRDWLETNLVVTTDQRVYQLHLKSVPGGVYNSTVAWNYPSDDLVQPVPKSGPDALRDELSGLAGVDLSNLSFSYSIEPKNRRHPPSWTPERVFNDGQKTYIAFPQSLGVMEAPAFFVTSRKGDPELANYRIWRNYFVVDRIVHDAQLILGDAPQDIVWIRLQQPVPKSAQRDFDWD